MKRYRVLAFSFDSRAGLLNTEISENWTDDAKVAHVENLNSIKKDIVKEYGIENSSEKIDNFSELGPNYISLISFHNKFMHQINTSYIMGSYYPALTATCALGERILNQLILNLRGYYKDTNEYKKVHQKESLNNWELAISTLNSWEVLLPKVVTSFSELKKMRDKAIHFNPETDSNDKALAIEAILKLKEIINDQFSGFGEQPWYIQGTTGACYVQKESEEIPFVKEIVIPCCKKVGHLHRLQPNVNNGFDIYDAHDYVDVEITDERFMELVNNPKLYNSQNIRVTK